MDIVNVNSALNALTSGSSSGITSAASLMVLDNAINLNEQMGANMVKLMENSVNPNIGSNIDVYV